MGLQMNIILVVGVIVFVALAAIVIWGFAAETLRMDAEADASRASRIEMPLDATARWKLNVAITLLESALFELQHLAALHNSVVPVEADVFRGTAIARRILQESRRAHGFQAEEGTGRRTGSSQRGDGSSAS
jgi:hypothetical protein